MFDRFTTSRGATECSQCHKEVLEGTICSHCERGQRTRREERARLFQEAANDILALEEAEFRIKQLTHVIEGHQGAWSTLSKRKDIPEELQKKASDNAEYGANSPMSHPIFTSLAMDGLTILSKYVGDHWRYTLYATERAGLPSNSDWLSEKGLEQLLGQRSGHSTNDPLFRACFKQALKKARSESQSPRHDSGVLEDL